VLGHSYGSTAVAEAAAGFGMHTDDVVLIGSTGTDLARSAADLHLNSGGHLYVGAASTDPVAARRSLAPRDVAFSAAKETTSQERAWVQTQCPSFLDPADAAEWSASDTPVN